MDENKLKQCCESLRDFFDEKIHTGNLSKDDLTKIHEQVCMTCTELAPDYALDNQKSTFSKEELNAMRMFFKMPIDDSVLQEMQKCKSGEALIQSYLSTIIRSIGDYDFGEATRIKEIIAPVLQEIQKNNSK